MTTKGQVSVVDTDGRPVTQLNELEYCAGDGLIYANVWYQNYVVAIDPTSGRV